MLFIELEAKHFFKEKKYQKIFCKKINGVTEFILFDRTRVDCITKNYAIEVDFASKWAESVGQSLYYADVTRKKAGVLLIIEKQKDLKHLKRLKRLAKLYKIKVWIVKTYK